MTLAAHRSRSHLHVDRGSETSRLQAHVIAAAYELVTPLIHRALRSSASDPPSQPQTSGAEQTQQRRRHA
jgi:hypothetical protein